MNSRELKERIRSSLPIETYIGRFVTLKRYNRNYKGLCPFHREKTPSFNVVPDKGIYHCFGCGRGGDIFAFVMEHEGVEFREAMEILARAAGIDTSNLQKNEKKDPAYDLLMRTARLYNEYLAEPAGANYLNYLKGRGIQQESIKKFQIGASPDQWQFLLEKFPEELKTMERVSLARKSEKTGKHFDFFRGRIMFPIRDASGQVVGFGGRILPGSDNPAKYMNSPESPVFHKSKVLYGLFENIASIRRNRAAIVTEGYLDVVGLAEVGIDSAVAPLGTALTLDHVHQLKRYADHVTLMLDGDAAGREAARKGASLLIGQGFQSSRMFFLPTGMDPFDLSRKYTGKAIGEFLESSVSSDSYLIFYTLFPDVLGRAFQRFADPEKPAELTEGIRGLIHDLRFDEPPGLEEKKAAVDRFQQLYTDIEDSIIREFYAQEAARILGIDVGGLVQQLKLRAGDSQNSRGERRPRPEGDSAGSTSSFPTAGASGSAGAGGGRSSSSSGMGIMRPGSPGGEGAVAADSGPADQNRNPDRTGNRGAGGQPRSEASAPMNPEITRNKEQLIRCERSLMVKLLSYPNLLSAHLNELRQLDFEDQDSEILWRVLEDRFLTGEGWDEDVLIHSNLPSRVMQSFSGLLAADSRSEGNAATETTFKELLLHHRILESKKQMSEIRGQMVVADEVEQSYLWERYSALLKETKSLEFQLRSQSAQNPKKPTHQGESGPTGVEN
ncbi:MAG: DNA primase [Spirochaetaceae bacterium]|nr:DNA primase [Spirochaetaceae bacterium]